MGPVVENNENENNEIRKNERTNEEIMESTKVQIAKLNETNYPTWKYKVEQLLIKEGLWKVIRDEAPEPVTEAWSVKDDKARAIIGLMVNDNQLIHITNSRNAKESWTTLKNYHEKATMTNKIVLMRKLFSTKMVANGNVENHVAEMLKMFDRLASLDENFKEHIVIAVILSSLPGGYDHLITALESRPEADLTKEFVIGKLRDEYHRKINGSNSNQMDDECVMKVGRINKPICYNCGVTGHISRNCYKPLQNQIPNRSNGITEVTYEDDDWKPKCF